MLLPCYKKVENSNIVLAPGFLNPKSESRYRFSSALEVGFEFFNVVQKSLGKKDSNAGPTLDLIRYY